MNIIQKELTAVQQNLNLLPPSFAENPQGKLFALCSEFSSTVDKYTTGSHTHLSFFRDLQIEFRNLAEKINGTRPNFEIPPRKEKSGSSVAVRAPSPMSFGSYSLPPPPVPIPGPAVLHISSPPLSDISAPEQEQKAESCAEGPYPLQNSAHI